MKTYKDLLSLFLMISTPGNEDSGEGYKRLFSVKDLLGVAKIA